MARAAKNAGLSHVIWSTLEDTREQIPLSDERMPTLLDIYKVPHFYAKAEANQFFTDAGVPTAFLQTTFYWENLITFMRLRRGQQGTFAGLFCGYAWVLVLGAVVVSALPADTTDGVRNLMGGGVLGDFALLCMVVGAVAGNAMNGYCGSLAVQGQRGSAATAVRGGGGKRGVVRVGALAAQRRHRGQF